MSGPFLSAAWEGLVLVFSWPNILYPIVGTMIAMIFALLPGLSGATLMALAIPLTFWWDPLPVLLLFGAFVGGATFMGSVAAILFNIPGRTSNAAALLDGHPLAQQGKAKTALACAATASALGSTFGILVLLLLIPVLRGVVMLFGPPEFLLLTIWGLIAIASLSRGSLLKGLIMGGLGLLISFAGFDPRTAELRYTFGSLHLHEGLDQVPAFLGLFAIAEVLSIVAGGRRTISGVASGAELSGSVTEGVKAVFANFGLFLRSAVIGTVIGIIPGVGATVASLVAYGHAAQTEGKRGGRFGHGDLRGVLAPEAAIDAKDGGSLVPTLAFGIPGGTGTAVLLTVLTIHGLTPGREMLTTNLSLTFVLIWSLFLSNWLTSLLGLALVLPLSKITTIPIQRIVPAILVMATVGAYIYRSSFQDVLVCYGFALLGYGLKIFGWPRIPLVIGMVLGPLFENSFHLSRRLIQLGRIDLASRPILLLLVCLTLVSLGLPALGRIRKAYRGWEES